MNDFLTVWNRFTTWCQINAPELLETFQPGATEAEITDLELHLNLSLPEDFKSYLRTCNGQVQSPKAGFYSGDLMSIEDIQSNWNVWQELLGKGTFDAAVVDAGPGVQSMWWHPGWVPFVWWSTGENTCLDLAPTDEGTRGQVLIVWHETGERYAEHPSFTAWLEDILADLDSGEIVYDRTEYNALVNVGDLE